MVNRQRHEMILERNHSSGVQKWCCPDCGQSLLVTWTPRFMTVIHKAGNRSALHTRGNYPQSGAGQFMPLHNSGWQEEPEAIQAEARLAPWIAWMEAIGFEKLWNDKVE